MVAVSLRRLKDSELAYVRARARVKTIKEARAVAGIAPATWRHVLIELRHYLNDLASQSKWDLADEEWG